MLGAKNEGKGKRGKNKVVAPIEEAEARAGLDTFLTPKRLQKLADERKAYEARRAETDEECGYDVGVVADVDFTDKEETAVADSLKTVIQQTVPDVSCNGGVFVNSRYRSPGTANKTQSDDPQVRFVLSPRHFNVPAGTGKENKQWLEAQNANGLVMRSPNDLEVMQAIHALALAGELANPDTRYRKTYSREVERYEEDASGLPVVSCV